MTIESKITLDHVNSVVAIVLNWNGKAVLEACIRSLQMQTYTPMRIVVVDNGSTDDSASHVAVKIPSIEIIRLDKNGGFGVGNNTGIRATVEPFIVMVNNDTILEPNCVLHLVSVMNQDSRIGSVATKIVLHSHPDRIDAAGLAICADGMSIGRGRMEPAHDYNTQEDIFFASDCCCLFRRSMLDQIGLYDESFFAYGENTDLGWRARRDGWRSVYVPQAQVRHHHSASSGSHSAFKALLVERNRIWVAFKNFPLSFLITGVAFTLMRYYWQAFGALRGRGRAGAFVNDYSKTTLLVILVKAYLQAIRGIPGIVGLRIRNRATRTLSHDACRTCIKAYGISPRKLALKD